jgi:tetratricopeptide (TPR) repeat protein
MGDGDAPKLSELLRDATQRHQQGQLDEAERLYRALLTCDPDHFDALNRLAIVALQQGNLAEALSRVERALRVNPRSVTAISNKGTILLSLHKHDEALATFDRAIELAPDDADAHYNRGNALRSLHRPAEALASYDQAISFRPGDIEALTNRGNALLDLEQHEEALASYEQALAINCNYTEALTNRGSALLKLKRPSDALMSFDAALALRPTYAEALNNRGTALLALMRPEEALASLDRALSIRPDYAEALNNRGNALLDLKRPDEALKSFEQAIAVRPTYADALNNRGNALIQLMRFQDALASYDRALAMKPNYVEAINNRGAALHPLGRTEDALANFEQALSIRPGYTDALNNRGNALVNLKRPEEALANFDEVLTTNPGNADTLFSRGTASLLMGNFAAGWQDYEHRFDCKDADKRVLTASYPNWRGGSVKGKRIIVYEEQGIGDTIQFFRYLRLLVSLGAEVTFIVRAGLHRLLRTVNTPIRMFDKHPSREVFDLQSALLSLPAAFRTTLDTIPSAVPYLSPESALVAQWHERLGDGGFKVGIAWQGNPKAKIDIGRSVPLRSFRPVADIPGVRLFPLQKHHGLEQLADLGAVLPIQTFGDEWDNGPDAFVDTAAIMANLDLVITSDTAVAHLAGALGRPVWVLLKQVPDWRWMLDRRDSPWYPTMKLYRQAVRDDWDGVLQGVAKDVAKLGSANA